MGSRCQAGEGKSRYLTGSGSSGLWISEPSARRQETDFTERQSPSRASWPEAMAERAAKQTGSVSPRSTACAAGSRRRMSDGKMDPCGPSTSTWAGGADQPAKRASKKAVM